METTDTIIKKDSEKHDDSRLSKLSEKEKLNLIIKELDKIIAGIKSRNNEVFSYAKR